MVLKKQVCFLLVFSLLFSITLADTQLFAQTDIHDHSTSDKFFKWLSVGSMVVGTVASVAIMGPVGLVVGPLVGAAAVSMTCLIFGVNPMYHWGKLFNFENKSTQHRSMSSVYRNQAPRPASSAQVQSEPVAADLTLQQAEAQYATAYKAYLESVESADNAKVARAAEELKKAQQVRDSLR